MEIVAAVGVAAALQLSFYAGYTGLVAMPGLSLVR